MSLLTVLIPGLGQITRGELRKGATMFVSALVAGALTAGLGWLACGVWSLVDLGAARPAVATGPSAPEAAGGGRGSLMPWLFKFAVLATCAGLALTSIRSGQALRSLKFLGVEMAFDAPLSQVADASGSTAGADPPGASALREESRAPVLSGVAVDRPRQGEAAAAAASDLSGTWSAGDGAQYVVTQEGSVVRIREMGRLFYIPVETATCAGTVREGELTATCTTAAGTTGDLTLTAAPDGATLAGLYRDRATGGTLPMQLYR